MGAVATDAATATVERLRARIRKLEDALLEYGRHDESCQYGDQRILYPNPNDPCDCGWTDTRRSLLGGALARARRWRKAAGVGR